MYPQNEQQMLGGAVAAGGEEDHDGGDAGVLAPAESVMLLDNLEVGPELYCD